MTGTNNTPCIRCGGCCKAVPCYLAQIWWGLTRESGRSCPELQENDGGTYTCLAMAKNDMMRREILGTGCHYPEWRQEPALVGQGVQG